MRALDTQAKQYYKDALEKIHRVVPHDHHVWGVGESDIGTMVVDVERSLTSLDQRFLKKYNSELRGMDVVGRLHVACPDLVQVWDLRKHRDALLTRSKTGRPSSRVSADLSTAAAEVSQVIRNKGISQLMLGGIECRGHRVWLTLYRTKTGIQRPFSQREAEFFRYELPSYLHGWLALVHPAPATDAAEPPTPFSALLPYELATLIACAEADVPHAPQLLRRQFPEVKKLTAASEKPFEAEIKRIHSHIGHTLKTALKATKLSMPQVRRMLIGRLA